MGRDAQLCCKTCKKNYYLGYGSYSSIIHATTLKEFIYITTEPEDDRKDFYVNVNAEKVLKEHEGHDLVHHSGDWSSVVDGNLVTDVGWEEIVLVEGYGEFEEIDMEKSFEGDS